MKKLLLILAAAVILTSLGCVSLPEKSQPLESHFGYEAYVKQMKVMLPKYEDGKHSETEYTEYYIYIGSEDTERVDREVTQNGIKASLMLVHPAEGVEAPGPMAMGWYAHMFDNSRGINMSGDLFTEQVWSTIPFIMKHIIYALGVNDRELLLISTELYSASISIFYDDRYKDNKRFHQNKLAELIEYFETHDLTEDISLSDMLATEI